MQGSLVVYTNPNTKLDACKLYKVYNKNCIRLQLYACIKACRICSWWKSRLEKSSRFFILYVYFCSWDFNLLTCNFTIMKKTSNGWQAVIETAKNNYFIEMKKIWRWKRTREAYSEGDFIRDWTCRDCKKSTFKRVLDIFRLHNNINTYEFMDY